MENFEKESRIDTINLFSKLLGKEMKVNVYIPAGYSHAMSVPVLYFLHGRNGDNNIVFDIDMHHEMDALIDKGEIEPFLIVFPQIDNSRGLNSSLVYKEIADPSDGNRMIHLGMYMDYILNEVIALIDTQYHTITNRTGRFIGGVSGGGHAALHIALRNQQTFCKVGGHMPALELVLEDEDKPYYPDIQAFIDNDPINIARTRQISDMEVFLDCGNSDEGGFYKGCELLQQVLGAKGVRSHNHLFAGGHNMAYICSNVERYLLFYGSDIS